MPGSSFDWSNLAFASKKPLRQLKATFIVAPREISHARFTQLIKEFLPHGNIVLGISKEDFVLELEGQPHFAMLRPETVQPLIDKVNAKSLHKIHTLHYFQRELTHILEKIDFARVVLVNGSWHKTFHTLPAYYVLANHKTPYSMVSPFASEQEAREYESDKQAALDELFAAKPGNCTEKEMLELANNIAKLSYDYSFQTGAILGKRSGRKYRLLTSSFNKVVPFQTHAMHYGASREKNFSPPNDLNHYDTVHAEVELLIKAGRDKVSLDGTTVFINLLPCPSCARMFSETDIAEFVYRIDHSAGYAIDLLQKAGKIVRRVV